MLVYVSDGPLIAPYYQSDRVTLYHGDCLEVMKQIEAGSVETIICDPPYGTKTNQRDEWMIGEFANVMPIILPECHRVGVPNAAFYSFTSWRNMADWIMRCSVYFRMQGFLIWDKGRHSGLWSRYSWQFHWEGIYFGLKGPRVVRKYMPDVLRTQERPKTPMQKPVDVVISLLEASTDVDHIVLDPFMGSGTTGVACVKTGRRFIGIEIEEQYCAIAEKRIREAEAQLPLLVGV